MKTISKIIVSGLLFLGSFAFAQEQSTIEDIIKEAQENSQLENLAQELLDGIGPRLVGTPQMKNAHDWAVEKYKQWGIQARNESFGTWRGWERGISHIDMLQPRVQSLRGTQLAWSPTTSKKGVTAEVITLPIVNTPEEFTSWLSNVKGKIVLISRMEPTGRPDYNWEKFATEDSFEKMKSERSEMYKDWNTNLKNAGYNSRTIVKVLEDAGAVGLVSSNWSRGFGTSKIFSARTKAIPTVSLELEDYTLLYRLAARGQKPLINITALSKQ